MTLEIAIFAAFRVAVSLPILRWPLAGGLLAIAGDTSDLLLREFVDLGGVGDYQALDKFLDQVYLALFLVVALRWEGVERRIAIALYVYRLAGTVLFWVTGDRALLMFFPNVFETWFMFVALLHHRPRPVTWTGLRLAAALVGVTALKLLHEWSIHGAQIFDRMTTRQFLDEVWRLVTGAW